MPSLDSRCRPVPIPRLILLCLTGFVLSACQTTAPGQVSLRKNPGRALDRAEQAWHVLQREQPGTPAAQKALQNYNREVRTVVTSLHRKKGSTDGLQPRQVTGTKGKSWTLTFDPRPTASKDRLSPTLTLADYSRCQVAEDLPIHGFARELKRPGAGVPVVLTQDDPKRATRLLHPPKGDFLPATAVLEFPKSSEARLRFYDPLAVSNVQTGPRSRPLPLAENLTPPLELALPESSSDDNGKDHLAPSVSGEDESRLYFLHRYDPTKIPVVFVHGLRSGPVIWKNAISALLADPELRQRYQPVCFVYPTGLPIPTSSARLRQLLIEARKKLDPGHRDAVFDRIILVGHSMGGLLSRMQVIDSGDDFWRAFYTASPAKILSELDATTNKMVRSSMRFHHLPNVRTVVFITTPHRGSEIADIGIVQTIARLILAIPKTAQLPFKALTRLPEVDIHPALRSFNEWGNTGVENLSTKHPYFKALAKRPILVPFHSVIGVGNAINPADGTDGVVPYWSAHLKGAASEAVVPYPHGCVEREGTVSAVMKILKNAR